MVLEQISFPLLRPQFGTLKENNYSSNFNKKKYQVNNFQGNLLFPQGNNAITYRSEQPPGR